MNRYMVVATFRPETPMDEVTAMIPDEVAAVTILEQEHLLHSVRVSVARDKVFLEISAADAAGAEATVRRLPMSAFWELETYQVQAPA